MSDKRTQDLVETLQDPFPWPDRFARLVILRSESGPSLAIATILILLLAIVLFAMRAVLFSENAAVPSVAVLAVSLSEGDREALDLSESTIATKATEAKIESQSEPRRENLEVTPLEPKRAPGLSDGLVLPGGDGSDARNAQREVDATLRALERLKQKKATAKAAKATKAARGKARGGVPSAKELSERLVANGAGTGDIQVSLAWNNGNDIDVAVVCPSGEMVYFGHQRSACGGLLDIDRNAGGPNDLSPVENIFWATGAAPSGRYLVLVKHYRNHGFPDPTEFIVRVAVDGQAREFRGKVTGNQPAVTVHQFTRR